MSQAASTSVSGNVSFADTKSNAWLIGVVMVGVVLIVWLVNRK